MRAIAMRMIRSGASHECLMMSTYLWNIINACLNGLTILSLGRSFMMKKKTKNWSRLEYLSVVEKLSLCFVQP